jgi:hypothetical protein
MSVTKQPPAMHPSFPPRPSCDLPYYTPCSSVPPRSLLAREPERLCPCLSAVPCPARGSVVMVSRVSSPWCDVGHRRACSRSPSKGLVSCLLKMEPNAPWIPQRRYQRKLGGRLRTPVFAGRPTTREKGTFVGGVSLGPTRKRMGCGRHYLFTPKNRLIESDE